MKALIKFLFFFFYILFLPFIYLTILNSIDLLLINLSNPGKRFYTRLLFFTHLGFDEGFEWFFFFTFFYDFFIWLFS